MGDVVVWVLLGTGLVWIGAIYYSLRRGLNEIIAGLTSVDERLARMESRQGGEEPNSPQQ
jgi:hypothetical protein